MASHLRRPALTCVVMGPLERLDSAMEQRRLQLGLEWRDVAKRAGLSYEAIRALRKTGQTSALSKHRIEDALAWEHGSVDGVLDGGEPMPADTEPTLEDLKAARRRLQEALRMDDPERKQELLADALALIGRAMEHGRYDETG